MRAACFIIPQLHALNFTTFQLLKLFNPHKFRRGQSHKSTFSFCK